jgi:hypothetical protein
MYWQRILLLSLFITCFVSCRFIWQRKFVVYKTAPLDKANVSFPINGIYFLENYSHQRYNGPPNAFFLYKDGSVRSTNVSGIGDIPEERFWENPNKYLVQMRWEKVGDTPGHFLVQGNKFVMELIMDESNGGFARNTIRLEGFVSLDSSIILEKEICTWCDFGPDYQKRDTAEIDPDDVKSKFYHTYYRPDYQRNLDETELNNLKYKFYRTDVRPDSSRIWFKDTGWYQKNVWYNQ